MQLTVAGIAETAGRSGSWTYTLYGISIMTVSIAIAYVYVWLRYF